MKSLISEDALFARLTLRKRVLFDKGATMSAISRVLATAVIAALMAVVSMPQPQHNAKRDLSRSKSQKTEDDANEALRDLINGISRRALVPGRKVFIQPTGNRKLDKLLVSELQVWGRWTIVLNDEDADLIIKTLTWPCVIVDAGTKERLYIARREAKENLVKRIRKELESLTLSKYLQIREGMSYTEVTMIVGRSGIEQSSNNIGGITTVLYEWRDGPAAMNAMFQNGKLIQKSQFGLK